MISSTRIESISRLAERLLGELGENIAVPDAPGEHPAIAWKRAGLLELSGERDGPARIVPLPLASAADAALMALKALAEAPDQLPDSGAQLLGERVKYLGLSRNGTTSPLGHCRLITCKVGRIAINLARESDWELLPALLGTHCDSWDAIASVCASQNPDQLTAKGAEMGMAIALDEIAKPGPWVRYEASGRALEGPAHKPLVVDLSSLWAGPLAGSLLGMIGAEAIKVESTHRPDGARDGNSELYALMNGAKRSVALDFRSPDGLSALRRLIDAADIVIEASRPRALRQLGIDASTLVRRRAGKVWLRILAHGDNDNRIGFGDDIGVAAGLPSVMERAWGKPLMVGDAIADPLSGLYASLAAWQLWRAGGGAIATVSMRDVVTHAMGNLDSIEFAERAREWQSLAEQSNAPPFSPRQPKGMVETLGQSTEAVMSQLC